MLEFLILIALTLFVCLQTSPIDCRPQQVAFDGSLMSCAMYGQAVAAEWVENHPKWRLKKYSCSVDRLKSA